MFKKIVFMGTSNFSVPILKSLYQNGYPIVTIYTQPPQKSMRGQKVNKSPIQKMAENLCIECRTPDSLKENNEEYNFLKLLNPDLVIVVAYGQLISKNYLSLSKHGFINIHASLLPKWRGAAPIQRSIMNLDKETGVSIMKIVEKLDAGPVMMQEKINVTSEMNAEDLSNKLSDLSSKLILECIDEIEGGKAKFIDQDEQKATYAKKINKEEGKINWDNSAENILAQINSLLPNPGAWFSFMGERYKILKASISEAEGEKGKVIDNNLTIACKSKSIKVNEIQRQGKNKQSTSEFLLGSKIKKETALD
jgi:methionyl-tRNA formyltransferase|tara:strand:- start:748 stop:1671 length:924 start_codon:yes stop_codon:yes gene_type:complete